MTAFCKNGAAINFNVFLASSADGKTGLTGATITGTISKDGGAYAAISGSITELSNGNYKVALNATDTNTNGLISFHGTASGGDPIDAENVVQVISFDPFDAAALGLSRIDAAITSRLAPTTAGRTLDVTATGEAGIDWANIGSPTTAVNLSGTSTKALEPVTAGRQLAVGTDNAAQADILKVSGDSTAADNLELQFDGTGLTGGTFPATQAAVTTLASDAAAGLVALQADTDDIQARLPATLDGANIRASIKAVDAGIVARASFAQDALDVFGEVRRFTAAGGSTTTVVFDAGASVVDDYYNGGSLLCVSGTGVGQIASIPTTAGSYVGATKTATLDRTVATAFDATSVFELRAAGGGASTSSGGGGGSPGAGLGQYRYVESGSTLVFDFFVQKMLVDSTETDPKVGKTGLTEANFTVKSCLGGSTAFTTVADAGHAIIELGGGFYRCTAAAAADYTDEDGEAVIAIYAPTDLSGGAETGLVWMERYTVGTGVPVDTGAIAVANWSEVLEGSATAADLIRLIAGVLAGKVTNFTTGTFAFKSLDGTKTRLTVTVDETGRLTIIVGNLT